MKIAGVALLCACWAVAGYIAGYCEYDERLAEEREWADSYLVELDDLKDVFSVHKPQHDGWTQNGIVYFTRDGKPDGYVELQIDAKGDEYRSITWHDPDGIASVQYIAADGAVGHEIDLVKE